MNGRARGDKSKKVGSVKQRAAKPASSRSMVANPRGEPVKRPGGDKAYQAR